MIVSEARLAANRRNALRSTGPKTPEGKERSRANALKHGLCSSVVVAEDAKLVQDRAYDYFGALRPQNHFQAWIVTEVSLLSIRIERCERIERRVRDRIAIEAEVSWEENRRLEACLLGEQLAHRPEAVVHQLRKSIQGCEWLMTRWAMLAHVADEKGAWTPDQTRLAFDLLATPGAFREGREPGAALDFEGRRADAPGDPAGVARREIAALKELRERVEGLDEARQSLARSDLRDFDDPELNRLRRYESTLHRRLRWCVQQLRSEIPDRDSPRGLRQEWLGHHERSPDPKSPPAPPLPEVKIDLLLDPSAPKSVHPPFDLELHELPAPGEGLDIPMILADRRQRKADRADARRHQRRRKLEKLRA
ncbi:hypothetical protein P12x_005661 [Tundrisphaera lichenicola]|uniref:hypothetical protein n=1 Tax=Tundrisphaera lichenicola TaxID=2029860 RepID=UPI003EC0B56E